MKRAPAYPNRGHRGDHGQAATSYYVTPRKTARKLVRTLDVACPSCGAEPGQGCVANTEQSGEIGRPTSYHPTRTRMATREDNRLREEAGTFEAARPGDRVAGILESEDTPECSYCGLRILLTRLGNRRSHTNSGNSPSTTDHRCPGSGDYCLSE